MHAVMQDENVGYIKRDKQVGEGKFAYKAITHDLVTATVRPLFLQYGIGTHISLVEGQHVATGKTQGQNNTPVVRFDGKFKVRFVNIDNPEDFIEEFHFGSGEDTGDKAPGKAESYAHKRAYLKALMIETGDDDEGRVQQSDEPYTAVRLTGFLERIEKAGDRPAIKAVLEDYVAQSKEQGWRSKETDKVIQEACSKRAGELAPQTTQSEPQKDAEQAKADEQPAVEKPNNVEELEKEMQRRDRNAARSKGKKADDKGLAGQA
jgi:hypothetical protein